MQLGMACSQAAWKSSLLFRSELDGRVSTGDQAIRLCNCGTVTSKYGLWCDAADRDVDSLFLAAITLEFTHAKC
jgi:hypothetical protein